jgi:hypothetical protein
MTINEKNNRLTDESKKVAQYESDLPSDEKISEKNCKNPVQRIRLDLYVNSYN